MLKTFAVALFAIVTSVGLAHATHAHKPMMAACAEGLRRLRQQKKLTQEQLAFEAELDLTYVGGIERGKRNPSLLVMARIAKALRVNLTKLFAE